MNLRDSELACGLLRKHGYKISDSADAADIIIFNTCSVRAHAEERVWSQIGSCNSGKIIGLLGCMAQNYKQDCFKRCAKISFVIGPQDIHKLPEVLRKLSCPGFFERKIWEVDSDKRPEELYHSGFYSDREHSFVVISEGCSNFCSYCVVPYVRGQLRHRRSNEIIKEMKQAVDKGIRRFTLLGQNVNAYEDGALGFGGLLKKVNSIAGLEEFGFLTSHPKHVSGEFFKLMRDLDKLRKSLHLPAQSGSERILKLMNRGYSVKFYLDLVSLYRKIITSGSLSTDIIVGFPTESAEDFEESCRLLSEVRFHAAYIFKYSMRPHTQAATMSDDVTQEEKEKRHKRLLDLQKSISRELKKERVGMRKTV